MGPCLWNVFFADVSEPASSTGGTEAKFADDLNVFQLFDRFTTPEAVTSKLSECRTNVHRWGKANRVTFDENKEHIIILHPTYAFGDSFNLLGCLTDPKLTMRPAVDKIFFKSPSPYQGIAAN